MAQTVRVGPGRREKDLTLVYLTGGIRRRWERNIGSLFTLTGIIGRKLRCSVPFCISASPSLAEGSKTPLRRLLFSSSVIPTGIEYEAND
ncbi:hypothetical protein E2C01_046843 [Portunus trituberculatus]|uniref:Uncharacterized protein n=1 Tax=Portunus trituberculatus TaxID=210409 RepID=A0A5B7FZL8_PORTR|nr:hypothetical protein [Portunus trituberculatus]